MKGKIIGGYEFKSKSGNSMASICVTDESRTNVMGIYASCFPAMRSNMPGDLKDLLNKTYIIDKDDKGFLTSFYEVK